MKRTLSPSKWIVLGLALFLSGAPVWGEDQLPTNAVSRLPIKELTVFKDGHAFVVRDGQAKVSTAGQVLLDELPTPILGTFWASSTEKNLKLASVTASQRIMSISRTALSIRELIEANPSAQAFITETNQAHYEATIIGFLTRSTEELAATSPPNTGDQLPQKANVVLLKTTEGTQALPLEQIQAITFKQSPVLKSRQDEFRNFLTLQLDWAGRSPRDTAGVGLMYVQKGVRWIPSYKVDLDGEGHATARLQATLVNEMANLNNATVHLVIGVPSFALKDTLDPMALQDTAAQLSQFFQSNPGGGGGGGSMLGRNFANNSIMSQVGGIVGSPDAAPGAGALPDLPEGARNEDLFVFTLPKVTLRKGARMVLPVAEYKLEYKDVFTLTVPFSPPAELGRNLGNQQQTEMARLLNAPKVIHKARLANNGTQPFTTAPALISRNGNVIAQSLMTYAAPGASADLTLTTAVDVPVKKTDVEVSRVPDGLVVQNNHFFRVNLKGQIHLASHHPKPMDIEVTRYVLGAADEADRDGKVEQTNSFEDRDFLPADNDPIGSSWNLYNWPWWWSSVNSVGRITWHVHLDPGQTVDLGYTWHYFWQ